MTLLNRAFPDLSGARAPREHEPHSLPNQDAAGVDGPIPDPEDLAAPVLAVHPGPQAAAAWAA
jgi:hypothetical protein